MKVGDCKLCLAKGVTYTKSDIVPKWFIKTFKGGPDGGRYLDILSGKEGLAYFYDDEALCSKCNNERISQWESPTKELYQQYISENKLPLDYGPWFFRFCASLSWRVLTYLHRVGTNRGILDDRKVAEALESWRSFLVSDNPQPSRSIGNLYFCWTRSSGDV